MAAPKGNQYAKGHGKGRPKTWDDDAIENEAAELLQWIKADKGLYINSFCRMRGIHPQRLTEWEKQNKVFAEALHEAQAWQEEKFLMKGLSKEWDTPMVRYTMARICGDKWKASWDQPEEQKEQAPSTIIINKIEK